MRRCDPGPRLQLSQQPISNLTHGTKYLGGDFCGDPLHFGPVFVLIGSMRTASRKRRSAVPRSTALAVPFPSSVIAPRSAAKLRPKHPTPSWLQQTSPAQIRGPHVYVPLTSECGGGPCPGARRDTRTRRRRLPSSAKTLPSEPPRPRHRT